MLRVRALDHVGLVVGDMDRSLRFYCDGLGLKLLRRSARANGVSSAVLAVGEQEINLFCEPDTVKLPGSRPYEIDHFCLSVESRR
jgi:catechol 2,3-dioxygenase-like lactoylglutathione lyase family enzyme